MLKPQRKSVPEMVFKGKKNFGIRLNFFRKEFISRLNQEKKGSTESDKYTLSKPPSPLVFNFASLSSFGSSRGCGEEEKAEKEGEVRKEFEFFKKASLGLLPNLELPKRLHVKMSVCETTLTPHDTTTADTSGAVASSFRRHAFSQVSCFVFHTCTKEPNISISRSLPSVCRRHVGANEECAHDQCCARTWLEMSPTWFLDDSGLMVNNNN